MKLLTDLFSTDYGLMSIIGLFFIMCMGVFFLRLFLGIEQFRLQQVFVTIRGNLLRDQFVPFDGFLARQSLGLNHPFGFFCGGCLIPLQRHRVLVFLFFEIELFSRPVSDHFLP